MKPFQDFAIEKLVPAARVVLLRRFAEHKSGADIGVENKGDGSPASRADREAEQAMRALIEKQYPDHGIIGEEFGLKNPGAEYVWVLDPLDGTREFLAKESGWGILIALMRDGKSVTGIIDDPLNGITWPRPAAPVKPKKLVQASVACTNLTMWDKSPEAAGAKKMFAVCGTAKIRLNCLGFAHVADGTIDLAAESFLKLHDIAALLPPLWQAGAQCLMPDGADYRDYIFDLANAEDETYTLITGRDPALLREALAILGEKS